MYGAFHPNLLRDLLSFLKGVMRQRKEKCWWEFSKWTETNGQTAAKQRQARPLLHHSLRKYLGLSPRYSVTQLVWFVCVCVCVCAKSTCASLLSSDKSNSYGDLHWRKVWCAALRASPFIPMPISSILQMTEHLEEQRAVQSTSVTVSYPGFHCALQMVDQDQSTRQALPSRQK